MQNVTWLLVQVVLGSGPIQRRALVLKVLCMDHDDRVRTPEGVHKQRLVEILVVVVQAETPVAHCPQKVVFPRGTPS